MYPVNDIFHSLQGEGPALGQPASFIRFSGCNLSCSYCDTEYQSRRLMALDELLAALEGGPQRVVLTGGEPLLLGEALVPLAHGLRRAGRLVDIESNGTLAPPPELPPLLDNYVISPKLSNSGVDESARRLAAPPSVAVFKFVVDSQSDLEEVAEIAARHPTHPIIIMPQAVERQEMIVKLQLLSGPVAERGWRLLPRLQVLLEIK